MMLEQINNDLKNLMKNGEKEALSVIRMLKSSLQLESISKKHELTDDEILVVIRREVKKRKESILEYQKYDKQEETIKLTSEVNILNKYLPPEASIEEINQKLDEIFNLLKPESIKDMGKVMKEASEKIKNADASLISTLVKERLTK